MRSSVPKRKGRGGAHKGRRPLAPDQCERMLWRSSKGAKRKELVVVTIYSGQPIQWPTREEWATQQRDAYVDHKSPHPYTASQKLSLYASEEEVAALITAMQELSRSYSPPGPEAAKQALQPKHGESFRQYSRRYSRMSDAKKQRAYMQLEVSGAIAKLQNDLVPYFDAASVDQPLLTEIIAAISQPERQPTKSTSPRSKL